METGAKSEEIIGILPDEELTDKQQYFSSSLTTATDESNKLSGFFKAAAVAASLKIAFSPVNALSTDQIERKPAIINQQVEAYNQEESTARQIALIYEQYEKTLFSYPGLVIDVEKSVSGDPISATVLVSIDGKEHSIQRAIRQIGFEVEPNMRVIVDGIERGGMKKLSFRMPEPIKLDQEELAIIRDL